MFLSSLSSLSAVLSRLDVLRGISSPSAEAAPKAILGFAARKYLDINEHEFEAKLLGSEVVEQLQLKLETNVSAVQSIPLSEVETMIFFLYKSPRNTTACGVTPPIVQPSPDFVPD